MSENQYANYQTAIGGRFANLTAQVPKTAVVGAILIIALVAFEIFNFDTTQYALRNLLGDVRFLGMQWAAILAIAFCAIDFAGLVRLFTPEKGVDEPREVWYLMGAWLLGATMNAIMTWWAISLTLLNHNFGNEVLTRDQLLLYVPIFVAVLVWLTRILFIGAFTVAGEHIFDFGSASDELPAKPSRPPVQKSRKATANRVNRRGGRANRPAPMRAAPVSRATAPHRTVVSAPKPQPRTLSARPQRSNVEPMQATPMEFDGDYGAALDSPAPRPRQSRVNRRPPRPAFTGMRAPSREKH